MYSFDHECAELAARARRGDRAALDGLRRKLGPQMPLVVRRVLRSGRETTPFERQVQRAARQVERYAAGTAAGDADRLVRRVSASVLEGFLAGLAPPPAHLPSKETVRV